MTTNDQDLPLQMPGPDNRRHPTMHTFSQIEALLVLIENMRIQLFMDATLSEDGLTSSIPKNRETIELAPGILEEVDQKLESLFDDEEIGPLIAEHRMQAFQLLTGITPYPFPLAMDTFRTEMATLKGLTGAGLDIETVIEKAA